MIKRNTFYLHPIGRELRVRGPKEVGVVRVKKIKEIKLYYERHPLIVKIKNYDNLINKNYVQNPFIN